MPYRALNARLLSGLIGHQTETNRAPQQAVPNRPQPGARSQTQPKARLQPLLDPLAHRRRFLQFQLDLSSMARPTARLVDQLARSSVTILPAPRTSQRKARVRYPITRRFGIPLVVPGYDRKAPRSPPPPGRPSGGRRRGAAQHPARRRPSPECKTKASRQTPTPTCPLLNFPLLSFPSASEPWKWRGY